MIEIKERNEVTGRVIKVNPLNRIRLSRFEMDDLPSEATGKNIIAIGYFSDQRQAW